MFFFIKTRTAPSGFKKPEKRNLFLFQNKNASPI